MVVDIKKFQSNIISKEPYNLANIADFNSLIAQSQRHNIPVFALSDEQIEQSGVILKTMIKSRDNFREIFSTMADDIHSLTERL